MNNLYNIFLVLLLVIKQCYIAISNTIVDNQKINSLLNKHLVVLIHYYY